MVPNVGRRYFGGYFFVLRRGFLGEKIDTFDQLTERWRWRLATWLCLCKQQRDFVILRHFFQRPDGSYIMVTTMGDDL